MDRAWYSRQRKVNSNYWIAKRGVISGFTGWQGNDVTLWIGGHYEEIIFKKRTCLMHDDGDVIYDTGRTDLSERGERVTGCDCKV